MEYLHWKEQTITDFSDKYVAAQYAHGFVFTRIGRGVMHQTRSARIDLSVFEASSENRRILKKTDSLALSASLLPMKDGDSPASYNFKIGKLAKDFYDTKFGQNIMSAQKVKEMLTEGAKSNFNTLLTYSAGADILGYCIAYENSLMMHYSYPFYDLSVPSKDIGLGMMIRAIEYAKVRGLKYIYLGSLQRPSDTYKLQFKGLEWFDGNKWQTETDSLKEILKA